MYDIPVRGTHSHSWVMIFDDELEAFQTYAKAMPDNCIFLVDTFDTIEGVKKAIEVGLWLKKEGKKMLGIRLDSGDLAYLSIQARKMLDLAGLASAQIVASNELDEVLIADLKRQGAPISIWGVGTKLVTGGTNSALDGVYKLSAVRDPGGPWQYKLKLSEQMTKVSNPGVLQVRRFFDRKNFYADAIYDIHTDLSKGCTIIDPLDPTKQKFLPPSLSSRDLLVPIFRNGELAYTLPSLRNIQKKAREEVALCPEGLKRFLYPHTYEVGLEKSLYDCKINLVRAVRDKK
jgi:nicotinate phosphoribosyltransferase